MLRGTTSAGANSLGFVGIIGGATFGATVPAGAAGAATLLGYHHYTPSEIGTDILDEIAWGNAGAPRLERGALFVSREETAAPDRRKAGSWFRSRQPVQSPVG